MFIALWILGLLFTFFGPICVALRAPMFGDKHERVGPAIGLGAFFAAAYLSITIAILIGRSIMVAA